MHQGARTDLCGGRGVTRVPTATIPGSAGSLTTSGVPVYIHYWCYGIAWGRISTIFGRAPRSRLCGRLKRMEGGYALSGSCQVATAFLSRT